KISLRIEDILVWIIGRRRSVQRAIFAEIMDEGQPIPVGAQAEEIAGFRSRLKTHRTSLQWRQVKRKEGELDHQPANPCGKKQPAAEIHRFFKADAMA